MLRQTVLRTPGTMWYPGMTGGSDMAEVKTGVITFAEANTSGITGRTSWADMKSPATWSTIYFILAVLYLLAVL